MLKKFREAVEQFREQLRLARLRRARQEAEMEQLRDRHRRRHPNDDHTDAQRSECRGWSERWMKRAITELATRNDWPQRLPGRAG